MPEVPSRSSDPIGPALLRRPLERTGGGSLRRPPFPRRSQGGGCVKGAALPAPFALVRSGFAGRTSKRSAAVGRSRRDSFGNLRLPNEGAKPLTRAAGFFTLRRNTSESLARLDRSATPRGSCVETLEWDRALAPRIDPTRRGAYHDRLPCPLVLRPASPAVPFPSAGQRVSGSTCVRVRLHTL